MLKKTIPFLSLLLFFLLNSNAYAGWKTPRENLDKIYIINDFRIFYTLKGKNSLPEHNKLDNNHNKIPDYIENLALRLNLSKKLYIDVLKFQDPLKSKRYQDVKYIDVHVFKTDSSSSGDGITVFNYKKFYNKEKAIAIKLSNDLRKGTLTPSHEYFHAIQNGYSMFKNRWYTEGTSRWAESIFKEGTGRRSELPKNQSELNQLLNKTYDAKYFWRKIAYLCDTNDGHFKEQPWMEKTLIHYPKLVEDNRIYGYVFMKTFFENLDKEDAKASIDRGLTEFSWKEKMQKYDVANQRYILEALKKSINTSCKIQNNEVKDFLLTIDNYIRGYDE